MNLRNTGYITVITILLFSSCAPLPINVKNTGQDADFRKMIQVVKSGNAESKDFKFLNQVEQALFSRDVGFLEALKQKDNNIKWSKYFFIANKLDQRNIAIGRLKNRSRLPQDYVYSDYPELDKTKEQARRKAAQYFYELGKSKMDNIGLMDSRFNVRSIYYSLDSVNLFESNYKQTDSLLESLVDRGATHIKINCPEELEIAMQSYTQSLDIPWTLFHINSFDKPDISLTIKESKPVIKMYRDTVLVCMLVNQGLQDSIQRQMFLDPTRTLANIQKDKNAAVGLVYSNLVVKHANFCYTVDWIRNYDKATFLYEVCDEFENIYRAYEVKGNREIVNQDNCPDLKRETKNMTDLAVSVRAKQRAIRKVFTQIDEVLPEIDLPYKK